MVGPDWGYVIEVWDMGREPDRRHSLMCQVPTSIVDMAFDALGWFVEQMQQRMVDEGSAILDLQWYAWRVQPTREQVQTNGSG